MSNKKETIKLIRTISVMPTNLYGENNNFDLEKSHVLPALIRKIHLGKMLEEENWDFKGIAHQNNSTFNIQHSKLKTQN